MKQRLLWKLLLVTITPVIAVIILVIWFAIDQLAAQYFMALMKQYDVNPTDIHQMFITSIHLYLLWATFAAFILAFILSYFLTKKVLRPLTQMTAITRQVAAGEFSARVEVSTGDEVGQLGISFNRMADSLEQIEQLRKNMVADVAHELRTPLTNLRGYIEALKDEVLPPSKDTFKMLHEEKLRLEHLVENLQQLARADAAKAYLNREKLDLQELLNQMLALYKTHFADKNITFHTDLAEDLPPLSADRDKILQAPRNLFENGWKYTPAGEHFSVIAAQEKGSVRVSCISTGIGISEEDLPYIYSYLGNCLKDRRFYFPVDFITGN